MRTAKGSYVELSTAALHTRSTKCGAGGHSGETQLVEESYQEGEQGYERAWSYLWALRWATSPGHRPCRWTHLAQTRSLCRRCRSSSSSLPLSVWPARQEGVAYREVGSPDKLLLQVRTCLHNHFEKKNLLPAKETWEKLENPTSVEIRSGGQLIGSWVWKSFNRNFIQSEHIMDDIIFVPLLRKKTKSTAGSMTYAFNTSTQEAEAGVSPWIQGHLVYIVNSRRFRTT